VFCFLLFFFLVRVFWFDFSVFFFLVVAGPYFFCVLVCCFGGVCLFFVKFFLFVNGC